MRKFFKKIKEGLEDALAHKKGEMTLHSEVIEVPQPKKSARSEKRGLF